MAAARLLEGLDALSVVSFLQMKSQKRSSVVRIWIWDWKVSVCSALHIQKDGIAVDLGLVDRSGGEAVGGQVFCWKLKNGLL